MRHSLQILALRFMVRTLKFSNLRLKVLDKFSFPPSEDLRDCSGRSPDTISSIYFDFDGGLLLEIMDT